MDVEPSRPVASKRFRTSKRGLRPDSRTRLRAERPTQSTISCSWRCSESGLLLLRRTVERPLAVHPLMAGEGRRGVRYELREPKADGRTGVWAQRAIPRPSELGEDEIAFSCGVRSSGRIPIELAEEKASEVGPQVKPSHSVSLDSSKPGGVAAGEDSAKSAKTSSPPPCQEAIDLPRSPVRVDRREAGACENKSCLWASSGDGRELKTEIDGEETKRSEKAKGERSLAERCGSEDASGWISAAAVGRKRPEVANRSA